jgi:ribosomal protein S18 acetylase RimI-like enzyme
MPGREPAIPEHLRRPAVGLADPSDIPELAGSLARAFEDDPALGFLIGEGRRDSRLKLFFAAELEIVAFPHEIVWATDDLRAAAIWARPGHWRVPVAASVREGPAMVRVFGRRLALATWTRLRMERLHPAKPPSYYLAAIGVDPVAQGRGLGGELLAAMLERVDEENVAAYLEASTERSRSLYARHGFVQTGEIKLPRGGPSIWPMWREPIVKGLPPFSRGDG